MVSGYAPPSGHSAIGDDPSPIIGRDPALLEVIDLAARVADTAATVLITGESGTGKELIAQLIRRNSGRSRRPFVAVNCGAIDESLQQSEFFGHMRGAFTGAVERKIGKLERAEGGTIFLDEISEMTPSLQAALLRTLQTGEYSPLGTSETRYSDVRVIAAANQDLAQLVTEGRFRQDLYYRLNIIRLELPPLRMRRGDIASLAEHFAQTLGATYGNPRLRISREALGRLCAYDYPGNIRELENFIRRAAILCRSDEIRLSDLPPDLIEGPVAHSTDAADIAGDFQSAKAKVVESFERTYITSALSLCGGIISRAAEHSGLSERNFHEKVKRYEIDAKSFRGPRRATA